ncbi:MAG: tetratricopeptide repeat protein [Rhodospirillales bacterium]|nr:tetratricopeptide repeat protein [Rhodospirillales bacterium]
MFRYIFVLLAFCLVSTPCFSADNEPSLIDLFGEETAQNQAETPKVEQPAAQPTDSATVAAEKPEKVDDAGIFSFLNFSFLRKKEKAQEFVRKENEPQENYLDRMTRLAEEDGDVEAALTLGYMYLYGENGVEADDAKAFKYYELAAAKDDIVALNNLGSLYFSGVGTNRDIEKAAALFKRAAELGNSEAAVNLAFIYLTARGGTDATTRSEVVRLFSQAAEGGNTTAQYMLGMIYYNGFGVTKNDDKAFIYLKKAASTFDEAQYQLGLRYMNAEGTPRNYGNAVKYLAHAANQGHVPSMIWLGDILSAGVNYPKNEVDAYVWYNVASVYDAASAAEKRDALEKRLKIEVLLQAQAKAEGFKIRPTEMTKYIHSTFGTELSKYVTKSVAEKPKPEAKNQ